MNDSLEVHSSVHLSVPSPTCSPSLSRTFRLLLSSHLFPLLSPSPPSSFSTALTTLLLPTCPLHSDSSLTLESTKIPYGPSPTFQSHKSLYPPPPHEVRAMSSSSSSRLTGNGWACGICGKRFRTLFYLDRHYEKHHQGGRVKEGEVCVR